MNDRQKKAATAVSLFIVGIAVAFLLWVAVEVGLGRARGDASAGRLFMLLIANWDALSVFFKAFPIVVSVGLAFVGAYKLKDWLFYAIVTVTVAGGLSVVYLWLELSSVVTAKAFWAYSPSDKLQDFESFVSAAHTGLGTLGAWFVAVLATELGIKTLGST